MQPAVDIGDRLGVPGLGGGGRPVEEFPDLGQVLGGRAQGGESGGVDLQGLPVVDGVAVAVKLAESLVALGLTTSRAGGYAAPLPKRRVWGRPDGGVS